MKIAAIIALAGFVIAPIAGAAETVTFIACPIYRDTDAGRKSGCWLADEAQSGRRFDISRGTSKPDWNHEVLVEGTEAAPGPDLCGGKVLEPVRTSILPGNCVRHMLPAEGYTGNSFVYPKRVVAPLDVPRKSAFSPLPERSFHIFYDFDSSFVVYQYGDYLLDRAFSYIHSIPVKQVTVTGWAATEPKSISGHALAEDPQIARERAEVIAESLRRLGVSKNLITVRWKTDAQPVDDPEADGLSYQSRRRVDIDVVMAN